MIETTGFNTKRLKERLTRLGKFVPIFEADGFKFAEMRGGDEVEPGVFTMPWSDLNDPAMRLYKRCYADGWVLPQFDWSAWMRTNEATELLGDPNEPSPGTNLPNASPEQLAKLLTALVRNDRGCEGYLHGAFESGLLLAIVQRARVLADQFAGSA